MTDEIEALIVEADKHGCVRCWSDDLQTQCTCATERALIKETIRKTAAALSRPAPAAEVTGLETIQTLLDLLNPLHGSLDEQTYDDKMRAEFDAPPDAEYAVNVTAQQERDLTQAVLILEDRKRQALAHT